jgi:hypothetical protein
MERGGILSRLPGYFKTGCFKLSKLKRMTRTLGHFKSGKLLLHGHMEKEKRVEQKEYLNSS